MNKWARVSLSVVVIPVQVVCGGCWRVLFNREQDMCDEQLTC